MLFLSFVWNCFKRHYLWIVLRRGPPALARRGAVCGGAVRVPLKARTDIFIYTFYSFSIDFTWNS